MSRNVTILVIILVILLIAGYLLWLRGRFTAQTQQSPVSTQEEVAPNTEPTVSSSSAVASPSASPTVTTRRPVSTSSGKVVK